MAKVDEFLLSLHAKEIITSLRSMKTANKKS